MFEKNDKFAKRVIAGVVSAVLLVGVFVLGYVVRDLRIPETLREVEFVLRNIDENYVGEFDVNAFIKAGLRGSLDAYSTYYTTDDMTVVEENKAGLSKGSLGFTVSSKDMTVRTVYGNSPAERAGLTEGGTVVGITHGGAYYPVDNATVFEDVYYGIEKGVSIILHVKYGEETEQFTMQKEDFIQSYVWYQDSEECFTQTIGQDGEWQLLKRQKPLKTSIKPGFAYIKLLRFNGDADKQLVLALNKAKQKGITNLVLDLRENGGGYMDILCEISGHLIPAKNSAPICVVEYKSGDTHEFKSGKNYYDGYGFTSIKVLCDSGTASASEVLIGAMLDYDAHANKNIVEVIVTKDGDAQTTYGKGIMQTTYTNKQTGSAVKLTSALLSWPISGIKIHGVGISPSTDKRVTAVEAVNGADAELIYAMG